MPTVQFALETITDAVKEQLARNANTSTLLSTVAALSTVIARHGPSTAVRDAAVGLSERVRALSQSNYVPRFVVHDMLEDFIRQIEIQSHRPSA